MNKTKFKKGMALLSLGALFWGGLSAHRLKSPIRVAAPPVVHQLLATPQTVTWGYYDAKAPPKLRIKSGEVVQMQTLVACTPALLEEAGLPPAQVQPELRAIAQQVTDKGPGIHILTGPIYVEDAQPGDVLEVRILDVKLAVPYAYNAFTPGHGALPNDFPYARMRIVPLDLKRLVGLFAPGIEVPLRPFFGSMGVAPPDVSGRISSYPPWINAGNIDNKEMVAGSTLFIPVHAPGALFSAGDGHAAQGDGEVDLKALETSLVGTFQFIVHKGQHLNWPRAETPTEFIAMGFDNSLDEAVSLATRNMVDFLVTEKHLSRDDAYVLCSVAVDLHVTQLVDGSKGVHAILPKGLFIAAVRK
jgi:acetamidase/formamidase